MKVDVHRFRVVAVRKLPRRFSVPQDVRSSPDARVFYVADLAAGGVWEIDPARFKVIGFIHTGSGAHGLVVGRNGKVLYVANRNEGSVSVISFRSRKVIHKWHIPGGGSPDMGDVSANGKVLWLSGRYNSVVYAIDTRTGRLIARIPGRREPSRALRVAAAGQILPRSHRQHALMRTLRLRPRVDLFGPAAASGLLAALLVWLGPPGTDLAAHVYQRTLFIQHGFVLWNNFWYAGRYSFVNYSVLYYPLAAAIGIKLLAVLTRHDRGGRVLRRRAARVGAAQPVDDLGVRGRLGSARRLRPRIRSCSAWRSHLLALWSLQHDRRWVFACLTLLTLAASPLAFLLLVVLLVAVALARRDEPHRFVAPAAAIASIGVLEFLMRRMFPGRGSYPFSPEEFLAACTFCLIGVGLTWRVAGAHLLRWTYVVYLVACTAAFTVSSPVGENIARLRFVAAPIAILTLSLRRWQPRFLCAIALTLALSWNLTPLAASFVHGVNDPAAHAEYWSPTITYLTAPPASFVPRGGGRHGGALAG